MNNIIELPEDCLSLILSLTSPRDVIRSSTVSKQFLAVSDSDTIWDKFLPSGHDDIIYGTSVPVDQVVTKKKLFMYLCDFPILLDNSSKSFALDKRTGKICYMLGSRALTIIWGSSPQYWRWEPITESRFPECAVLKDVCWLEILGKIHTKLLSPGTAYGVYFVFKFKEDSYGTGFGRDPVKVTVFETREDGLPIVDGHQTNEVKRYILKEPRSEDQRSPGQLPVARGDGWREVEMGWYRVGVNGERMVLEMTLREIERGHWKSGLVVHGIEIRPLP